jgi:hypothetical protein
MPGSALRAARGTLRVHPARRPISALPAVLLAFRSGDMRAALARQARGGSDSLIALGALSSGADPATFGQTSGAGH